MLVVPEMLLLMLVARFFYRRKDENVEEPEVLAESEAPSQFTEVNEINNGDFEKVSS